MRARNLTLALFLVVAAALTAWTPAQDDAPQAAAPDAGALAGIDDIQERVREGVAELQALEAELEGTADEERLVLERRARERRQAILESAYELVDLVVQQENAGKDVGAARAVAEDYLARVSRGLRRRIQEAEAELAVLRDSRGEQPEEALEDYTEQVAAQRGTVDELLGAFMSNVDKIEQLGLDAGGDRQFLADLLQERADDLLARMEVAGEEMASLRKRLAETPDDAVLQARLRAHETGIETTGASVESTLSLLKRLDVPAGDLRKRLIELTGTVTADIFDTDVAVGLLESWVNRARTWLVESGPAAFFKAALFILIMLAFRILSGIVGKVVRRSVTSSRLKFSQLLQNMLVSVVSRGVLILGLLLALSQLGVSLGPLLAGLGIAGFIIGFALQDTLGNFAAGVMILVYRPYDVNDLIETGGVFGKVGKMSLVSTTILTLDNQTLVVPNSKIWGDVIKNVTAQKIRRIDMMFGIGYGDDIPHAEAVLQAIVDEDQRILSDPEPVVRLHELGDSSVNFVVRPWVRTDDYWDVYWHVTREVKMRFDREGISIPFPQRDVHLHRVEPAAR